MIVAWPFWFPSPQSSGNSMKMSPWFCSVCLVLTVVATPVKAQVDELAAKLPSNANVVVGIDVKSLSNAPLAIKEGWMNDLEEAFVKRAVFLPPEANTVLIASEIRAEENFRQLWEAAVMSISEPISMRSYARAEGGYLDEIEGTEVVWSPSNAYLVRMEEQTLGVYYPAARQIVGRWLEATVTSSADQLTPFLKNALKDVGTQQQFVIAIDLKNMATPHRLEAGLQNVEALKKAGLTVPAAMKLIGSLQGAVVEVSVGEKATASTRLQFGESVNLTDEAARDLLLEALNNLGLTLPDLANHEFSVDGYALMAEGELSNEGLRRLFSVVEIPTTKFSQVNVAQEEQESSEDKIASASQAYFQSVLTLLDDLRTDRNKTSTQGGMDAVWMDRYARKIDRLPILNVDDELLDWGTKTAETLRIMSSARKNAGLSAGAQKSTLRTSAYSGNYYDYNYSYNNSGYGGSSADETSKNKAQIDRQIQSQATSKRVEGWQLIDDATADIRRTMTQRYNVEF